jgi:autotransporter-associated beta strand protein
MGGNKVVKRYLRIIVIVLALCVSILGTFALINNNYVFGSNRYSYFKPSKPVGLGSEFVVSYPEVSDPLPVVDYAERNGDSNKYSLANPIINILFGFDSIWSLNDSEWQNGEANGNGPESYENAEIRNSEIWKENIEYVVDVTNNRTDDEALEAYYDDRRDKCYSIIDGFGPLEESYLDGSGATTTIDYSNDDDFDVNEEMTYTDSDPEYIGLGDEDSELSGLYDIVWLLRQESPASTSGSKYFFSAPRPWRMNNEGEVVTIDEDQDGVTDLETIGGIDFEKYDSDVSVIPALKVVRRKAGGVEGDGGGRRKDGAYPSGHTNAGYLASIGFAYAFPERFSELFTRASELGENRIVAGMHSPLDVIGGRIQAQAVAAYAFSKIDNDEIKEAAYENAEEYFGEIASEENFSLYEYAHTNDESDWADHDLNKELYRKRITYGFSQTGEKGVEPTIPEGAETLLETKLPYLSSEQIRTVLYTTAVDSGYPVLDESNGWGRLDYVTASDGYGAFLGDVTVNMDASKGRYNEHDWWRNDISGEGLLTKEGTGTLTLTGDNTYKGGTLIKDGILEAESSTAFGKGDLYIENGTALVSSEKTLKIKGNLTIDNGNLNIVMDKNKSQIKTNGVVYIDGGNLELDLSNYDKKGYSTVKLIKGKKIYGEFGNVTAEGYNVKVKYTKNSIIAYIKSK